jgi:uncharacterized surface protein with fasciclin (FAS1) repeats
MRVFKIGLGALAVMVGLAGSVKADSMTDKDLVDVAVSAGSFKTLVAAVQAADLVDALKGEGPLTVFAPTDEAFAKLPAGTVENLLKPENKDKLVAVLTYHVVPGRVTSGEVVNLSSAKTINGKSLKISAREGNVMVDNARVTATDIIASNGVIHVIDTVVLPN